MALVYGSLIKTPQTESRVLIYSFLPISFHCLVYFLVETGTLCDHHHRGRGRYEKDDLTKGGGAVGFVEMDGDKIRSLELKHPQATEATLDSHRPFLWW